MTRIPDREWPATVVPGDEHERAQATGVLFRRLGWVTERLTRDERDDVERQLEFWYSNGYCPDALLIAVSALPGGDRQRPRTAAERPGDFLRSRLNGWFDDDAGAAMSQVHEPPRRGQTFEAWFANRRKQAREEGGYRRPSRLGGAGEQARAQAREIAAARRPDPVARVREAERRRSAALESLRPAGSAAPVVPPPAETRATPRMVASFAGRQAVAAQSPAVQRIVERLRAENRGPSPAEKAVLRNAVRDAHHHAGLGSLAAASAEVTDDAGELTPQARQIRDLLARATDDRLPVDAAVRLLLTGPESAGDHTMR
ncbi:hypothetical protein [Amycolatopsis jiangsuensis]|uniref:Uncharacterized protein n=1 Tax=Amycolatopsis jiangsuensis TaxID=1181879 RepID=A0A840IS93_9PSEU|nr:hypothetical protein [Amycolatopsis jiangsuensis]MBB4684247.1 hypothetical protein [Amycolatopsis jiangsuensis]